MVLGFWRFERRAAAAAGHCSRGVGLGAASIVRAPTACRRRRSAYDDGCSAVKPDGDADGSPHCRSGGGCEAAGPLPRALRRGHLARPARRQGGTRSPPPRARPPPRPRPARANRHQRDPRPPLGSSLAQLMSQRRARLRSTVGVGAADAAPAGARPWPGTSSRAARREHGQRWRVW
eukprot:SAG31_NODE_1801_length_7238_cov_4.423449_2_plen_177_part_00